MPDKFQYGVLLPHFGKHATRERLVEGSQLIERYGFDSVWVRDHIVFHPHEHEDPDRTHVDPIVVLSAISAATKNLKLGTATLIPHRHPIEMALVLASMEFIAGTGRIIAGWGLGTYEHEFDAIGMGGWDRKELFPEYIEIMRRLWTGEVVSYEGKFYRFRDVEIHPVPASPTSIPIWYGGTRVAAVRRAVQYCEGWLPGRMPRSDFRRLRSRMEQFAEEFDRPLPSMGLVPFVSPGKTVEGAMKYFDLEGMMAEMERKKLARPDPKDIATWDGHIMAGPPDVLVEDVRKWQEAGVQHLVFDLRSRFEDWDEMLGVIGEEVLPQLHRGDGRGGD
jgi:alkanesulfonate monooxygenase SsuD/methylene tetrahydromethanopterin reductase-like flavin-dependent oxidoreductase (luciferase family)